MYKIGVMLKLHVYSIHSVKVKFLLWHWLNILIAHESQHAQETAWLPLKSKNCSLLLSWYQHMPISPIHQQKLLLSRVGKYWHYWSAVQILFLPPFLFFISSSRQCFKSRDRSAFNHLHCLCQQQSFLGKPDLALDIHDFVTSWLIVWKVR